MNCGVVPYGFAYLEGELVVDPRETKVVHQMVKLWQSGKSFKAIADMLNSHKVPTRMDRKWSKRVVRAVVGRHLKKNF